MLAPQITEVDKKLEDIRYFYEKLQKYRDAKSAEQLQAITQEYIKLVNSNQ